jgi:hypothetical protein
MAENEGARWQVTCPCGWRTNGTRAEVVAAVQAHGLADHGRAPSAEEIMAIAVRADP